MSDHDPVNHPSHYASEAKCSGCGESIECIDVVRHMGFDQGNAIKYLWRAGKKDATVQDLKKAIWYIEDMIHEIENTKNPNVHRLSDGLSIGYNKSSEAPFEKYDSGEPTHRVVSMEQTDKGLEVEIERISESATSVSQCHWSDPEKLVATSLQTESYRFDCYTHKYSMFMPIDKAPERCDGATSTL